MRRNMLAKNPEVIFLYPNTISLMFQFQLLLRWTESQILTMAQCSFPRAGARQHCGCQRTS